MIHIPTANSAITRFNNDDREPPLGPGLARPVPPGDIYETQNTSLLSVSDAAQISTLRT